MGFTKYIAAGAAVIVAAYLAFRARASAPAVVAPRPIPNGPGAPAIRRLLAQVNARWPGRGKASDGIMGDAAHQARPSDHNTGDAIDITLDPTNGPDLDALAEALLADPRTKYVIWNKRIRSRTVEPGKWRQYSGANLHTKHLHLSIDASNRADDRDWNIDPDRIA